MRSAVHDPSPFRIKVSVPWPDYLSIAFLRKVKNEEKEAVAGTGSAVL